MLERGKEVINPLDLRNALRHAKSRLDAGVRSTTRYPGNEGGVHT